jgi:hypothetical protein
MFHWKKPLLRIFFFIAEYEFEWMIFLQGGEAVGPGMDCLQLRQPPGPFHYLISEQSSS